jgi:hypothetical protein
MIVSSAIMIVVLFAKVSALYPWWVISSLAKWLGNLLFAILYISFGVRPKDHYMPLQRFTIGHMPGLAKVVHGTKAMLMFPGVVTVPRPLLHHVVLSEWPCHFPLIRARHTPHIILISKQAIPYHTRGGTCCPVVSTSKIQSLADSSMTNHSTWQNPTISTIPNLAQTTALNLTRVTSHQDGWKTNTLNTQHKPNSTS